MKCRAMRVGGVESSEDIEDIRRLAEVIGIRTAQEALELVQGFYPARTIQPKTQFGLEEIFANLKNDGAAPSADANDK